MPIVLLAAEWRRTAAAERAVSQTVTLALLLVPSVNYVATYSAISRLGIRGDWWHVITAVNGLALLAAFLTFACVPARVRVPAAAAPQPAEAVLPVR